MRAPEFELMWASALLPMLRCGMAEAPIARLLRG